MSIELILFGVGIGYIISGIITYGMFCHFHIKNFADVLGFSSRDRYIFLYFSLFGPLGILSLLLVCVFTGNWKSIGLKYFWKPFPAVDPAYRNLDGRISQTQRELEEQLDKLNKIIEKKGNEK